MVEKKMQRDSMASRLKLIYDASVSLFINKGYSHTQIKDIAREIGLSTGMIYIYFKGKRDILNFIFACVLEPDFIEKDFELPISQKDFKGLEERAFALFAVNTENFDNQIQAPDYGFETMLSDLFDFISRYGIIFLLIEKNPDVLGKIFDYYIKNRKNLFTKVLEYVKKCVKRGVLRDLKYPEYVCQLIIQTLSWWGMHVMHDAFERKQDIPVAVAKEVCMDNIVRAYMKDFSHASMPDSRV